MQINMTTFAGRMEHYLQRTLDSLFSSDWTDTNHTINLMLGSDDHSHVQQYATHSNIRIVPWDMETDNNPRQNCSLNAIRALRYGEDGGTLICEDDILFSKNWCSELIAATAEISDEEYIISLFLFWPEFEKARFVKGKRLVKHYPRYHLVGAQALFYPTKSLRLKIAEYLHQNLRHGCSDEIIGRYARSFAALYCTTQPLVEHIGLISCFKEELDKWEADRRAQLSQSKPS